MDFYLITFEKWVGEDKSKISSKTGRVEKKKNYSNMNFTVPSPRPRNRITTIF